MECNNNRQKIRTEPVVLLVNSLLSCCTIWKNWYYRMTQPAIDHFKRYNFYFCNLLKFSILPFRPIAMLPRKIKFIGSLYESFQFLVIQISCLKPQKLVNFRFLSLISINLHIPWKSYMFILIRRVRNISMLFFLLRIFFFRLSFLIIFF